MGKSSSKVASPAQHNEYENAPSTLLGRNDSPVHNAKDDRMGAPQAPAELKVRNPRTGLFDYKISVASVEEVTMKAKALREAQPSWLALGVAGRAAVLQEWAASVSGNEALREALIVDTGRRRIAEVEVGGVQAMVFGAVFMAQNLLDESKMQRTSGVAPNVDLREQFDAIPLVGTISPWNFPLLLAMIDTLPALMAGCAVLLKPSEVTPRFATHLVDSIAAHPSLASVFQVVLGDGSTGAAVVDCVDAVAFTGSVKTGKIIAQAAAKNFIPCFLELGGKDALVVLPDADLDLATTIALRASVQATGQACQSIERVYVPDDRMQEFVERMVEKAQKVELTFPDPGCGQLGPIIFEPQAATIEEHIREAVAKGARILTGGKIENHGGGKWVRPTILVDVDHSMKVIKEETFGPIIPVIGYSTIEQAVQLANDSEFGLSAAVVGNDVDACEAVARKLDAGAVSINDGSMTAFVFDNPHTLYGFSGLGACRQGESGMMRYIRRKSIMVQRGPVKCIEDADEKHIGQPLF